MALPDPSTWNAWIWFLHVMGTAYLGGFFAAWARFRRAHRKVRRGGPDAKAAFNQAIRGFPWSFYAKMLGEHPYEEAPQGAAPAAGGRRQDSS